MIKLTFSIVLCIIGIAVHTAIALPTFEEGSAVNNSVSKSRVLGGKLASNGKLPWIVLIGYAKVYSHSFDCGGSIISEKHVLTAAHCILEGLSFIRAGEYDQTTTSDGKHQDVPVKRIFKHNRFNKQVLNDDIALLLLAHNIQFNKRVKSIPLNNVPNAQLIRRPVLAAGWGNTNGSPERADSMILKQLKYLVVPGSSCYSFAQKGLSFDENKQICASDTSQGQSVCRGDSGGPLMWNKGGVIYQIGIVSYGTPECSSLSEPNVFTSVAFYSKWIKQMMQYQ